jgi:segregation and condensation protein B
MLAEAALFMASEPLGVNELTSVMKTESFGVALKELERLLDNFNKNNSALEIIKTNDGKYQMCVRSEYASSVSHLAVDTEFSKAVLRTLGLIAVKQPVKQSIVVRIIGNKAYGYVKELHDKGLVHAKKQANTKILTTSNKFESYFGKRAEEIKNIG